LQLKKQQTAFYPLVFKPNSSRVVEGRLQLTNLQTNQHFEYKLLGVTEEPIASQHIQINCVAKQQQTMHILISNKGAYSVTYAVETDLPSAKGPAQLTVPGKSSSSPNQASYPLSVSPPIGGQFNGSITFTDVTNPQNYQWFTVQLQIDRSPPQQKYVLSTEIRKPVVLDIALKNKEKEPMSFTVNVDGEGLQGASEFTIAPLSDKVYELMFLPLSVGRFLGSLSFGNVTVGEIWYELDLEAKEAAPKTLTQFQAEIGKHQDQEVFVENPSSSDVKMKFSSSNFQNFQVLAKEVAIKSYDTATVRIRYKPTQVQTVQYATVLF